MKKPNLERRSRIAALYRSGVSVSDIMRRERASASTVYDDIHATKTPTRDGRHAYRPDPDDLYRGRRYK